MPGLPPAAEAWRTAAAALGDAVAMLRAVQKLLPQAWVHRSSAQLGKARQTVAQWEAPAAASAGAQASGRQAAAAVEATVADKGHCAGCGRKAVAHELSLCSRCKRVRYCSRACQVANGLALVSCVMLRGLTSRGVCQDFQLAP